VISILNRSKPALKSNFYYSFFFLPPKEKEALIHFYSFCRDLDDQIDLAAPSPPASRKQKLIQGWREELTRTFQGNPTSPLTQQLHPIIQNYRLSKIYFDEIINGMEMDILNSSYPTFEELKLYCYRVASAVGLVCMEIFGDRSENAKESAIHLGIAFQLTNILRDIFPDLENGRIYLPGEDFKRFGYSKENLKKRIVNVEFSNLIQFEIDRAMIYYEKAEAGLKDCHNTGKNVIEVMLKTYYQLLLKIERNIWNLSRKSVSLSPLAKISIAGKVWLKRKNS
jgi:phytoene synthase